MSLNLYLDDCSNSDLLALLLRQAGHRVVRPADATGDLTGADDDVHFAFAAGSNLTIITKNPSDFRQLHGQASHHSGILAVYQDNDPLRDMSDADIVKAIMNLEAAANRSRESFTASMIGGIEMNLPEPPPTGTKTQRANGRED